MFNHYMLNLHAEFKLCFFFNYSFAVHYVTIVLHNEAIIYFHKNTGQCELGNEKCMKTEVDAYNEVQKKYRI